MASIHPYNNNNNPIMMSTKADSEAKIVYTYYASASRIPVAVIHT